VCVCLCEFECVFEFWKDLCMLCGFYIIHFRARVFGCRNELIALMNCLSISIATEGNYGGWKAKAIGANNQVEKGQRDRQRGYL